MVVVVVVAASRGPGKLTDLSFPLLPLQGLARLAEEQRSTAEKQALQRDKGFLFRLCRVVQMGAVLESGVPLPEGVMAMVGALHPAPFEFRHFFLFCDWKAGAPRTKDPGFWVSAGRCDAV